jgi:phage N-6-adenine-methyltransferase
VTALNGNGHAVSAETAQEFTEALGQVLAGAVRLTDVAQEFGVPQALGLTPSEWTERRLAGHVRLSIPERRAVVAELTERGMSKPEIAEVLGVGEATVARDRAVSTDTPEPEPLPSPEPHSEPEPISVDTADDSALSSDEPVEDADVIEEDEPAADPLTRGQLSNQSGGTDEWATPQDFYDVVNAEFGFDLDVCALDTSAKCERYFTPETDGLVHDWTGTVWMNPPYGDVIATWMRKAYESARAGATVVCLVPARTDTGWFHDYCFPMEVRFIKGRLRFGEAEASAPFPSCLVVLGPNVGKRAFDWSWR